MEKLIRSAPGAGFASSVVELTRSVVIGALHARPGEHAIQFPRAQFLILPCARHGRTLVGTSPTESGSRRAKRNCGRVTDRGEETWIARAKGKPRCKQPKLSVKQQREPKKMHGTPRCQNSCRLCGSSLRGRKGVNQDVVRSRAQGESVARRMLAFPELPINGRTTLDGWDKFDV